MTQPTDIRRARIRPHLQDVALSRAGAGIPVFPLSRGKRPFGNCGACTGNACGGRPNMLAAGPCTCPAPCHGWAAATTDPNVINSPTWAQAWAQASGIAYHPGGAGMTVVDLDNAAAIAWARLTLPATRRIPTRRGEHWQYIGAMSSANAVRPGVDIKSRMAYARWIGGDTGRMVPLPDAVRDLVGKEPTPARTARQPVAVPAGGGVCRHRTPVFLERGIAMAEQRITQAREQIHATVYRAFLAVLSTHGRCGCLTEGHVARLFAAAQAKGETARHCADAWANARTKLGV